MSGVLRELTEARTSETCIWHVAGGGDCGAATAGGSLFCQEHAAEVLRTDAAMREGLGAIARHRRQAIRTKPIRRFVLRSASPRRQALVDDSWSDAHRRARSWYGF